MGKNTEHRISELLSLIQAPVFWKDIDGVYIDVNDAQIKVAGFTSKDEVIGKTDYEMAWKGQADEIRALDKKVMATGKMYQKEELCLVVNGEEKVFLSHKVPFRDENGNTIGVLGISLDVTIQKKLERQLKRAKELEAKAQNAKIQGMMEIAAGIAHEIRTPLTSIQCATDAHVYLDRLIAGYKMAEDAGLPVESIRPSHMEGLENIFNSIDAEAKESMRIIDMFLNNLKGMVKEANASDYQLCSIKDAVVGALARYPFDEKQKNIVFYSDTNDFKFYGVNLLVQHIIFNLIKNALYYISEKPGACINIWHEHGDIDNLLHFKDSGPGISEYDQTRIFDFGFSKRKDGSGFGLTYCKTTMQQMGGDISVRSELGEYTEFILTFPKVAE